MHGLQCSVCVCVCERPKDSPGKNMEHMGLPLDNITGDWATVKREDSR